MGLRELVEEMVESGALSEIIHPEGEQSGVGLYLKEDGTGVVYEGLRDSWNDCAEDEHERYLRIRNAGGRWEIDVSEGMREGEWVEETAIIDRVVEALDDALTWAAEREAEGVRWGTV